MEWLQSILKHSPEILLGRVKLEVRHKPPN